MSHGIRFLLYAHGLLAGPIACILKLSFPRKEESGSSRHTTSFSISIFLSSGMIFRNPWHGPPLDGFILGMMRNIFICAGALEEYWNKFLLSDPGSFPCQISGRFLLISELPRCVVALANVLLRS